MIGAVIEIDLHIHHGIACQYASCQSLLCALFHRGNILAGHAATEDGLREGVALTGSLGADFQPHIAILAMAAALFLMLALDLHALADSLTVSHPGLAELQLYAELAFQLLRQNLQMDLANAPQESLTGFLVLADNKGSIFLLLLGQGREDLVLFTFLAGRCRHFQHGLRIRDSLILDGIRLVTESIASLYFLKLGSHHDISCCSLSQIELLLALHGKQGADALSLVFVNMIVSGIALHIPGQDADKALPAHKGIHDGLEDLGGEGIFCLALLDFPVCRAGADGNLEIRRRHILHNAVHEVLDTHILLGRATEHREDFPGLDAFDKGGSHLYFGDFRALYVFLHELIVELSHSLNQLLTGFLDLALDVFRQFCHDVFMVVPVGHDLHMQGQKVCHALESRFLAYGHLHGHHAAAKAHPQLLNHTREIGMFPVHLVHEESSRQFCFLSILPKFLRLHFNARGSRNKDQGAVSCSQGSLHIAHKIRVARSLQEVQLELSPFAGHQLGADGHAPLAFFRFIVQ